MKFHTSPSSSQIIAKTILESPQTMPIKCTIKNRPLRRRELLSIQTQTLDGIQDVVRNRVRLRRRLERFALTLRNIQLLLVMKENILISGTRLDKRGRAVGSQHVVP